MAGIQNAHLLTDIFGYWPRFHDAEVHSILLERDPKQGAALEAKIHVFEMMNEVDDKGYYVDRHHTFARLRFQGVTDLELCDFNSGNVLFRLEINDISSKKQQTSFEVGFNASYGLYASFKCQEIIVVSAEACRDWPAAHRSSAPEGLFRP